MVEYKVGLSLEDADEVWELEKQCFPTDPWPKSAFEEGADNPLVTYVLAVEDGKIVGYAGIYALFEAADIVNVAVSPLCRRRGIARNLMLKLLSVAKSKGVETVTLEVRRGNDAAISLYESFGFGQVAVRKKYYENTYDALIYQLRI